MHMHTFGPCSGLTQHTCRKCKHATNQHMQTCSGQHSYKHNTRWKNAHMQKASPGQHITWTLQTNSCRTLTHAMNLQQGKALGQHSHMQHTCRKVTPTHSDSRTHTCTHADQPHSDSTHYTC
ncbi:hypothetical protein I3760_15G017200 [Carya illinoinensis]|uniref:Uncharacterized protein n=1 Tax=Carya illinoinensis TaxID=32201 RepID=A0A922A4Z6_CARIL|nr:hypothetical protein I3760_15G017200 [Carya illinoinensis]KAG6673970.1 hypothetical protein I3842_15G018500 [Carya illinoinensis]